MTKLTMMALAMAAILCVTSASCTADDTQFCLTTVTAAACAVKTGGTNPNCNRQSQRKSECKVKAGGTNPNCAKAQDAINNDKVSPRTIKTPQQACVVASGTDPKIAPKIQVNDVCAVKAGGKNEKCAAATTKALCTSAAINKNFVSCAVKAGGTNPHCASEEVKSAANCNTASTYGGINKKYASCAVKAGGTNPNCAHKDVKTTANCKTASTSNGISGAANVCESKFTDLGTANACESKTTDVGDANVCVYTDKNECIYTAYAESTCTSKSTAGGISGDANACVFTAASETTKAQKFKTASCTQMAVFVSCAVKAGGKNPHCESDKIPAVTNGVPDNPKSIANCNTASTYGGITGAANVCEAKTNLINGAYVGYSCYPPSCATKAGGNNVGCRMATSQDKCTAASEKQDKENMCEWSQHTGEVWMTIYIDAKCTKKKNEQQSTLGQGVIFVGDKDGIAFGSYEALHEKLSKQPARSFLQKWVNNCGSASTGKTPATKPSTGKTPATKPKPPKTPAPAPAPASQSAGQSLLSSSVMIVVLGMVMGVFVSL